LHKTNIQLH